MEGVTSPSRTPLKRQKSNSVVIAKKQKTTLHPTNNFVNPLLNDLYQITMAYSYWSQQRHELHSVFDLFFRTPPFKGEFCIFAGLDEVIRHVSNFKFDQDHIEYLQEALPACDPGFFKWLSTVDCSKIKVYAITEGTIVFPRLPLIRIEGPIAVAQMLETTLLTLVNYPSLVATNAVRHRMVTGESKSLFEFGLRRAQGPDGGVSASRYSYMGTFDGTSNVLAGHLFGIPIRGTHAHAYVTSFIDEQDLKVKTLKDAQSGKEVNFWEEVKKAKAESGFTNTNEGELVAFTAYSISFPNGFTALVDTYDTLKSGVANFLIVSLALHRLGYKSVGIRLDSGDLSYLSIQARKMFKKFAAQFQVDYFEKFNIVASNDINEKTLGSLKEQGHEIDTFGIGTNLVTCQAQPALGCVYKLVEIEGHPRIKLSQDVAKVTLPARKNIYRLFGTEFPLLDIMTLEDEPAPVPGEKILCLHPFDQKKRAYVTPTRVEPLLKLFWNEGEVSEGLPSLDEIRTFVWKQIKEMRPDHVRALNPTPYKISVTNGLYNLLHNLWLKEVPIPDIQ